jgi:hypothetical protein
LGCPVIYNQPSSGSALSLREIFDNGQRYVLHSLSENVENPLNVSLMSCQRDFLSRTVIPVVPDALLQCIGEHYGWERE